MRCLDCVHATDPHSPSFYYRSAVVELFHQVMHIVGEKMASLQRRHLLYSIDAMTS